MKLFFQILFFFLLCSDTCFSQDSPVLITPSMLKNHELLIGEMAGWLFKEGHSALSIDKKLDVRSWRKIKPTELSSRFADKNGKVEGWFRLKVKLDTTFKHQTLAFCKGNWAASDLYLDGKLIQSFGNTGANGKPFEEYNHFGEIPKPINLELGKTNTIVIHFVDYISPFPQRELKSEREGLIHQFKLTDQQYTLFLSEGIERSRVNYTIWISISCLLTFIFGLLACLNPREKNLRLFALYATTITLLSIGDFRQNEFKNSFFTDTLIDAALSFIRVSLFIMILAITARVFKDEVFRSIKIIAPVFLLLSIVTSFYSSPIVDIFILGVFLTTSAYYLISSWRTLKGAQWSVVVGLLLVLSLILVWIPIDRGLLPVSSYFIRSLISSGLYFALPFSLLVYIAIRFKEIQTEKEENAAKVLQVTEEKKELLARQNEILEEQIAERTTALKQSLENLQSTQTQLIQSEKLASLGELTAGIAHEIQNPLNFVNNFAEVSAEMLDEMHEELEKGDTTEAIAIAIDLKTNLEKINHHGQRASSIVKGMLEHSRASTGVKEPTDLNALADEYLRLAYHGLRAKDNSFNAALETHFDPDLPLVSVIPQDIGRVFLNLINNAFYAVHQRATTVGPPLAGAPITDAHQPTGAREGHPYHPAVTVSTKRLENAIEIRVQDNGNGIPESIRDKIFQPFFTTKPTGQGTGLGLSLAYDIVVKGHGGTLDVKTGEGKGAIMIICLPHNFS